VGPPAARTQSRCLRTSRRLLDRSPVGRHVSRAPPRRRGLRQGSAEIRRTSDEGRSPACRRASTAERSNRPRASPRSRNRERGTSHRSGARARRARGGSRSWRSSPSADPRRPGTKALPRGDRGAGAHEDRASPPAPSCVVRRALPRTTCRPSRAQGPSPTRRRGPTRQMPSGSPGYSTPPLDEHRQLRNMIARGSAMHTVRHLWHRRAHVGLGRASGQG